MRVSAAAWSSVIPFFSRCARRLSPSLLKGLRPFRLFRSTQGLRPFHPSLLAAARAPIRHDVHLAHLPGPLRGAADPLALHDVDETASAREADRHLAREHRHGSLPCPLLEVHGLFVPLVGRVGVGMFALMSPVMTSTDGRCVATTRWIPVAGASCEMRVIAFSTWIGAVIMRSASSSMTMTMYGIRSCPVRDSL